VILPYSTSTGFQFSHSYLSFYDKLEKANHFLENMIELVEKPLNDRLIESFMDYPIPDSGTWGDAVFLIKKYGLVPESVFPETHNSEDTDTMNDLLAAKLREHALKIRAFDPVIRKDLRFADSDDPVIQRKTDEGRRRVLRQLKNYYLREIYNILTICMGVPPQPSETFIWEFTGSNGKYAFWRGPPLLFREVYVDKGSGAWEDDDPLNAIVLINDPRHEYGKILVAERFRNYQRTEPTLLLNVKNSKMRKAVVQVSHSLILTYLC
jgi:bleomycin hydrolase